MKNSPWKLFISGDANHYQIIDETGNWVMAIQYNGEEYIAEQLKILHTITRIPEIYDTFRTIAEKELPDGTPPGLGDLQRDHEEIMKLARKILSLKTELYKRRTPTYKELLQTLQDIAKFPLPRETENSPYFIKNSYEEIINLARKIL